TATAAGPLSDRTASAAAAQSSRVKRAVRGIGRPSPDVVLYGAVHYHSVRHRPELEATMDWLLDQLLPAYDFRTRFAGRLAGDPARVGAPLYPVPYPDPPAPRVPRAARPGGRARLTGPLLQTMPLTALGRREDREAVIGRVAKFWLPRPVSAPSSTRSPEGFAEFAEPGWAKAAMSFQLRPLHGGAHPPAAETPRHATAPPPPPAL